MVQFGVYCILLANIGNPCQYTYFLLAAILRFMTDISNIIYDGNMIRPYEGRCQNTLEHGMGMINNVNGIMIKPCVERCQYTLC